MSMVSLEITLRSGQSHIQASKVFLVHPLHRYVANVPNFRHLLMVVMIACICHPLYGQKKNVRPEIVGQKPLSVEAGKPLTVSLNDLIVVDPDDHYPEGFTLKIYNRGNDYSVTGITVVPKIDFDGFLKVPVSVNDGKQDSKKFDLTITVTKGVAIGDTPENDGGGGSDGDDSDDDDSDGDNSGNEGPGKASPGSANVAPTITGQASLTTPEDTPLSIQLQHIYIVDPDDSYPNGFSLTILDGKNYIVKNADVVPAKNFTGMLSVPVIVNDGQKSSAPYSLAISVTPVNDAPVLTGMEEGAINYIAGMGPVALTQSLLIADPDGDEIVLAEIAIDPDQYRKGYDRLIYDETILQASSIKGVFDEARGILLFVGNGSVAEYQHVLRSVQYDFLSDTDERVPDAAKTIYFTVSDGHVKSETVFREIDFNATVDIDIPRFFTPNGDMANDTWKVTPFITSDDYSGAVIRVYNQRGQLLYEANGFDGEWDGTYKGEYLPSDSYFYVISLNLSYKPVQYRGVVSLLR